MKFKIGDVVRLNSEAKKHFHQSFEFDTIIKIRNFNNEAGYLVCLSNNLEYDPYWLEQINKYREFKKELEKIKNEI